MIDDLGGGGNHLDPLINYCPIELVLNQSVNINSKPKIGKINKNFNIWAYVSQTVIIIHTTAGEVTNLAQAYMIDAGKEIIFEGFILEMST